MSDSECNLQRSSDYRHVNSSIAPVFKDNKVARSNLLQSHSVGDWKCLTHDLVHFPYLIVKQETFKDTKMIYSNFLYR